jgi:hypothetical protein
MTYSELDDLKSAWQSLSRSLDRQHALALHQFRENKRSRFRAGFRPLVLGQIIQLLCGVLLSILGGSFWFDHLGIAHLMVYGISVHAYGILLIVFAARDLFLVKQLDYAAPVVEIQRQIAELRAWHLRAAWWFGVTGCFIWVPLILLIFYRLGADVWLHRPAVVGWLLLSGLVSLGVFYGIMSWERSGKAFAENSGGRSVNRAQALLDEIERFERQ